MLLCLIHGTLYRCTVGCTCQFVPRVFIHSHCDLARAGSSTFVDLLKKQYGPLDSIWVGIDCLISVRCKHVSFFSQNFPRHVFIDSSLPVYIAFSAYKSREVHAYPTIKKKLWPLLYLVSLPSSTKHISPCSLCYPPSCSKIRRHCQSGCVLSWLPVIKTCQRCDWGQV